MFYYAIVFFHIYLASKKQLKVAARAETGRARGARNDVAVRDGLSAVAGTNLTLPPSQKS